MACGHPEGASTSAHLLCCRLLTYAQYVGEPAPRIRALVNALMRNYQVEGALGVGRTPQFSQKYPPVKMKRSTVDLKLDAPHASDGKCCGTFFRRPNIVLKRISIMGLGF